jgi:hypothetical protein
MSLIFPPKRIIEAYDLVFDFESLTPSGLTLTGPSVVCSVISGVDPDPAAIVGAPTVSGLQVLVPVSGGLAGVIYRISVQVSTSAPVQLLELEGPLAVLA